MYSQFKVLIFSGDGVPHHDDDKDQSQHGQKLPACKVHAQRSWRQSQEGTVPSCLLLYPSWVPPLPAQQTLDKDWDLSISAIRMKRRSLDPSVTIYPL